MYNKNVCCHWQLSDSNYKSYLPKKTREKWKLANSCLCFMRSYAFFPSQNTPVQVCIFLRCLHVMLFWINYCIVRMYIWKLWQSKLSKSLRSIGLIFVPFWQLWSSCILDTGWHSLSLPTTMLLIKIQSN